MTKIRFIFFLRHFNGVFSMTNRAEIMFSELGQVKTDFITQEEAIEINCIIILQINGL